MLNPEAPRLVGIYRRALPAGARRAIAARVHPGLRRHVKLLLAGAADTADRARAARSGRRHRDVVDRSGLRILTVDRDPKLAVVLSHASPLAARRANLREVLDTLSGAGIDHFCVRGRSNTAAAVAVCEDDRDAVLAALAARCAEQPGYVTTVRGNTPVAALSRPGFKAQTWRRVAHAPVVRLTWYRTDVTGSLVLGTRYGCDIEFWREENGELIAPRPGKLAESIPVEATVTEAPEAYFTDLAPRDEPGHPQHRVRTRAPFAIHAMDEIRFPIDVVYTWVDGADPEWRRRRAAFSGDGYHEEAANPARYLSRDELRYSLRSLHLYAPWVRTVYLVTDDQVPAWLETAAPGIKVVGHRQIFRSPDLLPTFNSHAIESQLHHIDGLSEHFLYFNDDVLLGREVTPQDFFLAGGLTKFFPSPALVPLGEKTADDPPVAAAAKNNRRLIEERYGAVLVQKMKHMPHPLRRSVLYEIEEEFAEAYARTEANRFRAVDDVSVVSSLHHYVAFSTGRAIPGQLPYSYLDLTHPLTENRLGQLLARRNRTVFCINDTLSTEDDAQDQQDLITPFLEAYFPVPGPFEKGTAPPRQRT